MRRSITEIVETAGTVGVTWFPSVVEVDKLLVEVRQAYQSGINVGGLIDVLLDYRSVRSLEEKFVR